MFQGTEKPHNSKLLVTATEHSLKTQWHKNPKYINYKIAQDMLLSFWKVNCQNCEIETVYNNTGHQGYGYRKHSILSEKKSHVQLRKKGNIYLIF